MTGFRANLLGGPHLFLVSLVVVCFPSLAAADTSEEIHDAIRLAWYLIFVALGFAAAVMVVRGQMNQLVGTVNNSPGLSSLGVVVVSFLTSAALIALARSQPDKDPSEKEFLFRALLSFAGMADAFLPFLLLPPITRVEVYMFSNWCSRAAVGLVSGAQKKETRVVSVIAFTVVSALQFGASYGVYDAFLNVLEEPEDIAIIAGVAYALMSLVSLAVFGSLLFGWRLVARIDIAEEGGDPDFAEVNIVDVVRFRGVFTRLYPEEGAEQPPKKRCCIRVKDRDGGRGGSESDGDSSGDNAGTGPPQRRGDAETGEARSPPPATEDNPLHARHPSRRRITPRDGRASSTSSQPRRDSGRRPTRPRPRKCCFGLCGLPPRPTLMAVQVPGTEFGELENRTDHAWYPAVYAIFFLFVAIGAIVHTVFDFMELVPELGTTTTRADVGVIACLAGEVLTVLTYTVFTLNVAFKVVDPVRVYGMNSIDDFEADEPADLFRGSEPRRAPRARMVHATARMAREEPRISHHEVARLVRSEPEIVNRSIAGVEPRSTASMSQGPVAAYSPRLAQAEASLEAQRDVIASERRMAEDRLIEERRAFERQMQGMQEDLYRSQDRLRAQESQLQASAQHRNELERELRAVHDEMDSMRRTLMEVTGEARVAQLERRGFIVFLLKSRDSTLSDVRLTMLTDQALQLLTGSVPPGTPLEPSVLESAVAAVLAHPDQPAEQRAAFRSTSKPSSSGGAGGTR